MWKVLGHLEVKFIGGLFMGVERWCSRGGLVLLNFLISISCVGSTHSCHLQVVECHTIGERIGFLFEFLSWLLCGDHKREDLCCIFCASSLMFVGLYLLFVNMLVELSFDFRGRGLPKCLQFNYDLGVGTCFQVNLLAVYDYYSMWNPKWKAMCFSMCAFIIVVSLGVMIGVVNGWARDKVIMKSWSPNRSCLTFGLPRHID